MTPPEPDAEAPHSGSADDSQNTDSATTSPLHKPRASTAGAPAAAETGLEDTPHHPSPLSPADRQATRLKRPTHPGRPIHAPGASGLLEASEVPIPKPPSRPSSRPAQRPTSLLGTAPTSRPAPRPTDPLAPASTTASTPAPTTSTSPAPSSSSTPEPEPPPPPRTPSSRPATLRPATPRRDTPTALSGPLSAPPGSSPLSPTQPQLDLTVARATALAPSTRPTRPSLPDQPSPLPLAGPHELPLVPSHTHAEPARHAPRFAIATALLLALLLPSATHPPWSLLDQPSGPTALALAALLLLPALTAGPPHLVRWALRVLVAVTLTALSALAMADAHTHPPWGDALDPLHGSLSVLGLSLLLGAALADSAGQAPRLAAIGGALLLLSASLIPGPAGVPLLRLLAPLSESGQTTANIAASLATLTFAALALTTAAIRAISPRRRLVLALLTWLGALAPLIVHTALSTPPGSWMDAFVPLKASLAFVAAILLCADAIAPALEPEPSERSEAF